MREELDNRPSVALLIGLIVGLVSIGYPAALLFLVFFLVLVQTLRSRLHLGVGFAIGLLIAPSGVKPILEARPLHDLAVVRTAPKLFPDRQVCLIDIQGRTLQMAAHVPYSIQLGDRVQIDGTERSVSAAQEGYAAVEGFEGTVTVSELKVTSHGPAIAGLASSWRESFIRFIGGTLEPRPAALVDGVCFGSSSLLDRSDQNEMKRNGLIHIVTASGLQVLVLVFLLNGLLSLFPLSRASRLLIIGGVLALYCLAAGLGPAVVRASIMVLAGQMAFLFRRDADALSGLASAGIGFLLWRPQSIYNAGFQLSFVAVACLLFFYHPRPVHLENSRGFFVRLTNEYLRFSLVLWLAITPLGAYYFGSISMVSFFSNLLTAWCLPGIAAISWMAHAVSIPFGPLGREIATTFLPPLTGWIECISRWMGGDGSVVVTPEFSGFWLVAFYGAWAMTYRRRVAQP